MDTVVPDACNLPEELRQPSATGHAIGLDATGIAAPMPVGGHVRLRITLMVQGASMEALEDGDGEDALEEGIAALLPSMYGVTEDEVELERVVPLNEALQVHQELLASEREHVRQLMAQDASFIELAVNAGEEPLSDGQFANIKALAKRLARATAVAFLYVDLKRGEYTEAVQKAIIMMVEDGRLQAELALKGLPVKVGFYAPPVIVDYETGVIQNALAEGLAEAGEKIAKIVEEEQERQEAEEDALEQQADVAFDDLKKRSEQAMEAASSS